MPEDKTKKEESKPQPVVEPKETEPSVLSVSAPSRPNAKQAVVADKVLTSVIAPPLAFLTKTDPRDFYKSDSLPLRTSRILLGFGWAFILTGAWFLHEHRLKTLAETYLTPRPSISGVEVDTEWGR